MRLDLRLVEPLPILLAHLVKVFGIFKAHGKCHFDYLDFYMSIKQSENFKRYTHVIHVEERLFKHCTEDFCIKKPVFVCILSVYTVFIPFDLR